MAIARKRSILLGGTTDQTSRSPLTLFRLMADGSIDPSFGRRGRSGIRSGRASTRFFNNYALTIQADGRIVVAGAAERVGKEGRIFYVPAILRYKADGKVDTGFGRGAWSLSAVMARAQVAA